ncbi:MAG TPA: hypothetical protein VJJ76_00685 [archaeon]|nr:hypothetical protein [archaeon]
MYDSSALRPEEREEQQRYKRRAARLWIEGHDIVAKELDLPPVKNGKAYDDILKLLSPIVDEVMDKFNTYEERSIYMKSKLIAIIERRKVES